MKREKGGSEKMEKVLVSILFNQKRNISHKNIVLVKKLVFNGGKSVCIYEDF